jgi:hypothetical protein
MSRAFFLIGILFLSLAVQVFADQAKPTKFPGGGASDLLNNTKFNPDQIAPKSKSPIQISANCEDGSGKKSGQGEQGFERCVAEKQSSAARPTGAASTKPSAAIKFGSSK